MRALARACARTRHDNLTCPIKPQCATFRTLSLQPAVLRAPRASATHHRTAGVGRVVGAAARQLRSPEYL